MLRAARAIIGIIFSGSLISSCAHSYTYVPEVRGQKSPILYGRDKGIEFPIPSTTGEIQLKLICLGIQNSVTKPDGEQLKITAMQIRMIFTRNLGPSCDRATVNPWEQNIVLGGLINIQPIVADSHLSQSMARKTLRRTQAIALNCTANEQVIDLYFPLPSQTQGAQGLSNFDLRWIVHYRSPVKNRKPGVVLTESRSARFDQLDSAPTKGELVFPENPFYPFDVGPSESPNQVPPGAYWRGPG